MITITLSVDEIEMLRSLMGTEVVDQQEFNYFYDLFTHYLNAAILQESKAWNI